MNAAGITSAEIAARDFWSAFFKIGVIKPCIPLKGELLHNLASQNYRLVNEQRGWQGGCIDDVHLISGNSNTNVNRFVCDSISSVVVPESCTCNHHALLWAQKEHENKHILHSPFQKHKPEFKALPLASGTSLRARAAALMTKSFTETEIPCFSETPHNNIVRIILVFSSHCWTTLWFY